jgi:hypothetical protein
LIRLTDIPWDRLAAEQTNLYLVLVGIMLIFSLVNLITIVFFSGVLMRWISRKTEYVAFMNGVPTMNIGILVPVASLSMTANVILAPLSFFIPSLAANLQALMLPALVFFGLLLFALLALEITLMKTWFFTQTLDPSKLSFVWLIDAFTFGLVNLTGSGIATMAQDQAVASIAAVVSYFALGIGALLFVLKFGYLIYVHTRSVASPQTPVLPSYFLVVPIACLFGLSLHRMAQYTGTHYQLDMGGMSSMLINMSYAITIGWVFISVYLLRSYLSSYFYKGDFHPTMWAMV